MIAAGGTGGHIYPGLALAEALLRLAPEARVRFMGSPRGLEKELIPRAGYELDLVDVVPLAREVSLQPLIAGASLVRAAVQARRLLRRNRTDAVAGMGGYPSLPAIVGARLAGIPSLVHESGAVAGLANRIAARFTRSVAVAFAEASDGFPGRANPRVVGMPLSNDIARMDRDRLRADARASFGLPDDARAVFVMGGSQGAVRLNRLALDLAERWKDREDVRIVLKAGRAHLDEARAELARSGGDRVALAVSFFERMDHAYAAADLGVTRAGAATVAELPAAGLPAVVVPYPHAPGDHQTLNAQPLVRAGAAVVVADAEATARRLGPLIEGLIADPARLAEMGAAARTLARPKAADDLAAWVLDLAGSAR